MIMSPPPDTQTGPRNTENSSTEARRFKCDTCQRQFHRREHLQRHERIHFGHKPFHCSFCQYSCRRSDLLSRHVKLSHSKKKAKNASASQEGPSEQASQQPLPQYDSYTTGAQTGQEMQAVSSELCPPAVLAQTQPMRELPPYTSGAGDDASTALLEPAFLNAANDSRLFPFSYLDNVSLPPIFDQAVLYPGVSFNDSFVSPVFSTDLTQVDQFGVQVGGDPTAGPSGGILHGQAPFLSAPEPDRPHINTKSFLRVSQDDWLWLSARVFSFHAVLPTDVTIPSRHAISRYMHGFMTGFHPHFPIIHLQTLQFRKMAPELILALAAVGSQYCLEAHQGLKLFPIAKAIAMEQLRQREAEKDEINHISPSSWTLVQSPKSLPGTNQSNASDGGQHLNERGLESRDRHDSIETIQALFFLMAMATWGGEHRSLVRQALATQSVLAMAVRQHGLSESPQAPSPLTWEEWAGTESARRTKLIIFSFFNLHTLAFNVPCPLLIADIQLRMPCPEMEWKSTDAISWRRIHQDTNESPLFQDCINALLSNNGVLPVFSSLGAHVLIHALLQRIITIQQAVKLVGPESQMTSELTLSLKQALKKWQNGWEQNPESSYSPLDQYGPIAFNSRALYHLAYIRLSIDIGSASSLLEKTPDEIAKNLHDSPRLQKSPHLLLAAKHATAALCSPVQMGVHFVGRAPSWSVMHAVCSLEYAYALNRFLEAYVLSPGILQHDEQALIDTIKETLYEVETALPDGNLKIIETEPRALGPKAVRAWAMILQGMQTWNAVSLITKCLFAYADLLEQVSFQNTTRDL